MLKSIYTFELSRLLRSPSTYGYFGVFFAIALVLILGTGGFFDSVSKSVIETRLLNSAYEIHFIIQYFNKIFLFLLPAIIGMVIFNDFKHNVYPILYTYPLKKSDYLFAKFLSALTIVFLITFSIGMAFYLGEIVLGPENPKIGPTNFWGYASAYLFFVLPNMFLFGLMVFVTVASFRSIYAGFIVVILLLLVQIMIDNLFAGDPFWLSILDPFGQNAATYETRFWTIPEQNSLSIPVTGIVLWNRLLWTTISFVFFGIFYWKFKMEQETFRLFPRIISRFTSRRKVLHMPSAPAYLRTTPKINFSFRYQLKAMYNLTIIDFRFIIKSWLFHILVLFAILALVFAISRVTNRGDMTFLPLTRIMLSLPMIFFTTVITILTFIYSGMLVHRARMARTHQLIDATATSNWVLLGSKIMALLQVHILLLLVMMICGIGLQIYNGYYHFEIELYLFHLFVITLPSLIIWAAISVFIHTLLPNVYAGIFVLLLIWLGKDQMPQLGIDSYLFRFNSPPLLIYSDLNHFGNMLSSSFVINAYWLAFAGMVIVVTYLFWGRGFSYSIMDRLATSIQRLKGYVPAILIVFGLLFSLFGFRILVEETSPFKSVGNNEQVLQDFRTNFNQYKSAPQPMITSVKLNIAIYPESNSFSTKGEYILVNKTTKNIDTLLIKTGFDEITTYEFEVSSKLINENVNMQFAVHVLDQPLLPGDTLRMYFDVKNKPNTLFYQNSSVLRNGTFLGTDILPRLGYFFDEASSEPDDSLAMYTNFYTSDADLVDIETIISTESLQTAIAPGCLKNQWVENNRNYFHYKTDDKVKFAFAFNSGIYVLNRSHHNGVNLEIYHHKNHASNLKDMKEGLKAALDYNGKHFGSYQHKDARIIEFPLTEGTHASVMGNNIPTSEVRFTLANGNEQNKVNLSFYVQAHEMTHQWWGNQLVPADALGAKMLTESITEYISLRIYEKYFGYSKAQQFLSLQRKRYLEGRTNETDRENPLYLVQPDQEYIAYGKGAMAFTTLQYHIGEDTLNSILKKFLEEYKFRTDRYPTTIDLINHLKESISPEYHYVIKDMMETITFYENKIMDIRKLSAKEFEITYSVKKLDRTMKNELTALDVLIHVGQYDGDGKLLHTDIGKASSGENKLAISLKEKTKSIVLDPFLNYIELNIEDNRMFLNNMN